MKNKTAVVILIVLIAIVFALFAYLNTFETDAGALKIASFPTATPTLELVGEGWWNELPTPRAVETMKP